MNDAKSWKSAEFEGNQSEKQDQICRRRIRFEVSIGVKAGKLVIRDDQGVARDHSVSSGNGTQYNSRGCSGFRNGIATCFQRR